ncbi:hypothetical protein A6763_09360 [Aeromonas caviae]|nr:hypothetical protein A6763_09360 [Aeromonas caviae]
MQCLGQGEPARREAEADFVGLGARRTQVLPDPAEVIGRSDAVGIVIRLTRGTILPGLSQQGAHGHQLGATLFPQLPGQGRIVRLPVLDAATGEHEIPVDAGVHQQQSITTHHHGPHRGPFKHPVLAADLAVDEADIEGMGPLPDLCQGRIHGVR